MLTNLEMPISESTVAERVRERILADRKKRIGRTLVMVALVSAAMVVASMATRDHQTQRNEAALANRIAQTMQHEFESTGRPVSKFPDLGPAHPDLGQTYEFNVLYPYGVRTSARTGVCAPRSRLPFYMRESGRYVITFDGQKYATAFLTDEALRREAKLLGFSAQLTD